MNNSDNRIYVTADQIVACACSTEEQETVIQISRDSKVANIWSSDNTEITRMKKMLASNPRAWKCWEGTRNKNGDITGYYFECPKRLISYRSKTAQMNLTEEERQERAVRLSASRGANRVTETEE